MRFERPGNESTGILREHPGVVWDDGDMSSVVFDFDNDGWQDVFIGSSDYPGTRGLLFHQDAPGWFEPVPVEDAFEHWRNHGVAVADFDRDGDLDIVVGHSHMRCEDDDGTECYPTQQVRMFENKTTGPESNWLQLHLVGGPGTNRAAIGARVTVSTTEAVQTRDVDGGHGHFGTQRDLTLHFGLGAACQAEVHVRWPDLALSEQTFTLDAGRRYRVVQGEAPETLPVPAGD